MKGGGKTGKRALATLERDKTVIALRVAGYSFAEIQEKTGVTLSTAYRIVKRYIKREREKLALNVPELVTIETQRLDLALRALQPKVEAGDVSAINQWIKVSESRRKLLGLDAQEPHPPAEVRVIIERADERLTNNAEIHTLPPPT